jgi:aconitate hydratase
MKGDEQVTILGLEAGLKPRQKMEAVITFADGKKKTVPLDCRIMTLDELEYFKHGGIMQYVIRQLLAA